MRQRILIGLLFCVAFTGCDSRGTDYQQTGEPRLKFAARRASRQPIREWQQLDTTGSAVNADGLYVSPRSILTNDDVQSAGVERGHNNLWVVVVKLNEPATRRFADASSEMTAEPREMLAIFVDDKLVVAPFVTAPMTDGVLPISGPFSEEKAREIAKGIVSN